MLCLQVEAQCRFSGQFLALDARLEQADQNNAKQIKKHEYNLGRRMKSVENSLGEELQLLKQEYHKGGGALSLTSCYQWVNICMILDLCIRQATKSRYKKTSFSFSMMPNYTQWWVRLNVVFYYNKAFLGLAPTGNIKRIKWYRFIDLYSICRRKLLDPQK